MKLTVLVDNNTLIDRYLLGEPGVSYLIQEAGKRILFDTGYSDVFMRNAQKMNLSLYDLDHVVISHGHIDHTWGLVPLIRHYTEAIIEKVPFKRPMLVAHPETFLHKHYGQEVIGSLVDERMLNPFFDLNLRKEPFWITDRLVFLGEIPRVNDFENQEPIGKYLDQGIEKDDFVMDDTALAYKSAQGLVIITGCSHAGICNIIEYAQQVCNEHRVADIIGGLHLLNPSPQRLELTKSFLRQTSLKALHACHCTDFNAKSALSEVMGVTEVGAGSVLDFE